MELGLEKENWGGQEPCHPKAIKICEIKYKPEKLKSEKLKLNISFRKLQTRLVWLSLSLGRSHSLSTLHFLIHKMGTKSKFLMKRCESLIS